MLAVWTSSGHRRKRTRFKPGLLVLLLIITIPVLGYCSLRNQLMPVDPAGSGKVTIEIPKNSSTAEMAALLKKEGLIHSEIAFRFYARYNSVDGKLKPGVYSLHKGMSVEEIIQEMLKGPVEIIKITVPEGYTVAQIAELVEKKGIAGREEFLALADRKWDYPFLENISVEHNKLEGYLYPDTYHLGPGTPPEKLVQMMLERFNQVIKEHNYRELVQNRGLTLHEAVTIASMVEREAKVAEERARIAGVIYNRLEKGMPLQIDATIQYVLDKPREILLYKDLEVKSPYNTYRNTGLPPGPIANPGWPSLEAVIKPEKHEYLYYVAKPDGSHAFSRTLQEHNMNIRKYQKSLK